MYFPRFFKTLFVFFSLLFSVFVSANTLKMNTTHAGLDTAWKNRHSSTARSEIIAYIQTNPIIPDDFESAWKLARLVYFVGNFDVPKSLKKKELMQIFQVGYEAAEIAQELKPNKVEGYYWYAINLGKYSLTKGKFAALGSAKEGRDALLKAAELDPTYHWAGPYRILGKYYAEVPSSISFGDKKIAEEYYKKSIELAPEFRLNTMYLAKLVKDKKEKKALFEAAESKKDIDGVTEESVYKMILSKDMKKFK